MNSETDNINQFLNEQLLDLEQRFNIFMKEMEDDIILPSLYNNESDSEWDKEDILSNDSYSNKKQLLQIDKHTTALCLTGSITVTVLVYLGMVLSN